MAICKLGPVVEAISGNLGGVCFANDGAGCVLRKRQRNRKSLSHSQIAQLTQVQRAQNGWRALTAAQRLQFRRVAQTALFPGRLGMARHLTGYQLYLQIHSRTWITGAPSMTFPPQPSANQPILLGTCVSHASSSFVLNFWNPYANASTNVRIDVSRSLSTSKPSFWRNWRHLNDVLLSQTGAQFMGDVRAIVGDPQTGEWVAVRFSCMYQANVLSQYYLVSTKTT